MDDYTIWKSIFSFLYVSLFWSINYESTSYKPFGFRYWLGWFSWLLHVPSFLVISMLTFSPLNWKFLWSREFWIAFILIAIWLGYFFLLRYYLKILVKRRRLYKRMKRMSKDV